MDYQTTPGAVSLHLPGVGWLILLGEENRQKLKQK